MTKGTRISAWKIPGPESSPETYAYTFRCSVAPEHLPAIGKARTKTVHGKQPFGLGREQYGGPFIAKKKKKKQKQFNQQIATEESDEI